MKKIILVRHGKSAWDQPFLADHDRPLAERGLKDVPKMAKRLRKRGVAPDLLLSSTATRAMQTAELTAKELEISKDKIHQDKNLYHASPHTILKSIRMQPDSVQTLLVFGHNPGFNDLITYLGGDIDNLPTSGQFGFKLNSNHWSDLSSDTAEIWFMDYPKKSR